MCHKFHRSVLNLFKTISIGLLLSATIGGASAAEYEAAAALTNKQQVANCSFAVDKNWWTTPYSSVPGTIADNPVTHDNEFCEFYQFAQDWFLYLISSSATKGLANWEDPKQYPLLETGNANSCDGDHATRALHIRTAKVDDAKAPPVLPERIDQAGAHAIYDQNGNVVFYEVRFSRNLCDYEEIQKNLNFPGKTVELKLAWRVLDGSESKTQKDTYYQTSANIDGTDYLLGLAGWHIVVAADNHPEMIWITLDRDDNAVDCEALGPNQTAYPFTSLNCATDKTECNHLNQSLKSTAIKLPNGQVGYDICRAFPYGTLEGQPLDTNDGLNIALIRKLNAAMPAAFKQKGIPSDLTVWNNYKFKGALWVSDITKPSATKSNQRGSLELANAVMETTFQGIPGQANSSLNCFGCHGFKGSEEDNTSFNASLSHSFDNIIMGQCGDVQTSRVVNSQSQAEAMCPQTCGATSTPSWNGQWTNQDAKTGAQLPMTVCGCCPSKIVP